ncbi:hypothetical protein [Nostoc sp.]|uniref:hypothetical protein n=1 Tax=Nostoc sp. TaxID=1180 RepID=UPI002FF5C759
MSNEYYLLLITHLFPGGHGSQQISYFQLKLTPMSNAVPLRLTDEEREALHTSAQSVHQDIERSQEIIRDL